MEILIRSTALASEFSLHFDAGNNVYLLRQTISKEMNIALESFYICYDQEILEDQNTLEDYGMQEGAIIYCVIKPRTDYSFLAKLDDGTSFKVNFRLSDKVQKIKRMIGEKVYGKRCRLSMMYKGVDMKDKEILRKYMIKNNEEVNVIRNHT